MPSWANAHVAPRAGDCVGPGLAHEEHEPFFEQFNGKQQENHDYSDFLIISRIFNLSVEYFCIIVRLLGLTSRF